MRRFPAILSALFLLAALSQGQGAGPVQGEPSPAVRSLLEKAVEAQKEPDVFLSRLDTAILTARSSHDPVGTMVGYRIKAQELQELGRTQEAASAWQEVAKLAREMHSATNLAESLGQYAFLARNAAPAQAEDAFRELIEFAAKDRSDPFGFANFLFALAEPYQQAEDFSHAYRLWQTCVSLLEIARPDSVELAKAIDNLGEVLQDLHDVVQAEAELTRSVSMYERLAPNSLGYAAALNNLAAVEYERGELGRAEEHFQRTIAIKEKLAPDTLSLSKAYNNLGGVYDNQGKSAEAKKMYLKALAIREKVAPNSPEMVNVLHNLAPHEQAEGDLQNLRKHLYQAADLIHKLAPDSLKEAQILDDIARVEDTQQNSDKALAAAARAWVIYRQRRAEVLGSNELEEFTNENWGIGYELMFLQGINHHAGEAFMTGEQTRAYGLEQVMWEQRTALAGLTPTEANNYRLHSDNAQKAYTELQKRTTSYEVTRQLFDEESAKGAAASTAVLQQLQAEIQEKIRALQDAELEYRNARSEAIQTRLHSSVALAKVPEITPAEVQALMREEGTYFLEYSIQGSSAFLFMIEAQNNMRLYFAPLFVKTWDPRTKDWFDLAGAIRNYRALVTAPDADPAAVAAQGHTLFHALFPTRFGIEDIIRNKAKHLIISPDGALWTLPFAALVTNESGPPNFLGIDKPITYAQSFAVYRESKLLPSTPTEKPRILAVGGVTPNGKTSGSSLAPLPFSAAEASEIAALYHDEPLIGPAATKDSVEKMMGSVDLIQFVTHGFYDMVNPMSSSLVLSAPAQSREAGDSTLQAWEILNQPRLHADLVVLSACDSGRGEAMRSEGIIGLTRAFQEAGAHSVLSSLWHVSDESTKDLMVDFHKELRSGVTKDEALRRAMARVHAEPGKWSPYHWAAFMLSGNPDNPLFPAASSGAQKTAELAH